ncbi:unnamed protein product [Lactuca saligna]|uniref:Uncharacterized protein n=1 Tax=Lactuca saligna TaxID=75948 RepID=A0AA35Z2G9_LACSI|nr:unnamed protein product [Lactuca saligna]
MSLSKMKTLQQLHNLRFRSQFPRILRNESDDEAPVTRGKLKAIHEKVDSLLHASKSSSTDDYSQATVKYLLETLTQEHSTNLEKMNKVINASANVCNNMTKKVDKLITDATVFMEKFQSSFESNTTKANEIISSLGSTLKTKKSKLQEVVTGIKSDHAKSQSSISSQISKLQDDLTMENKIMDALAVKTEMASTKSDIADVTGMLSDIIETRDSMTTVTVKKHLAEKLSLVFTMLHQLEGDLESIYVPKQGGEGMSQSKKEDPKPSAKPTVKSESEPKGKEKLYS